MSYLSGHSIFPGESEFARLALQIAEAYAQYRDEHRDLMAALRDDLVDLDTFTERSLRLHQRLADLKAMRARLQAMKPRL